MRSIPFNDEWIRTEERCCDDNPHYPYRHEFARKGARLILGRPSNFACKQVIAHDRQPEGLAVRDRFDGSD
jgi:hypothetical protein